MGYVQSASTVTLRARLTQKGREELLSGTTQITVKYFALGDGDANYRTNQVLSTGKVPDVTGDYSGCTLSLADGVGLHYPIPLTGDSPTVVVVPAVTATTKDLLFCCGTPSNIDLSGNTMICNIYVNRLMNAENKILYEWYDRSLNADTPAFNFSLLGAPSIADRVPGSPTTPIQFSGTNNGTAVVLGGEPYANFYDFLCVNERAESGGVVTNTQYYDDIEFQFASSTDRYLWELINNIIIYKDDSVYDYLTTNGYYTHYTNFIRTGGEQGLEVNNGGKNTIKNDINEVDPAWIPYSPMVTSFSSLDVGKLPSSATKHQPTYNPTNIVGAGPGGLLVSAREMGYYSERTRQGNQQNVLRGFLPTMLVEGGWKSNYGDSDANSTSNHLYPCVRIKKDMIWNTSRTGGQADGYLNHKNPGSMEHVFIYDAFSGYAIDNNYNPNTFPVGKYSKFYDPLMNRGEFMSYLPQGIYSLDKLKWDPFNPKEQNPNGVRGFSTSNYTPSEYALSQMAAFDHIITQGRLLRLDTDPFIDYDAGNGTLYENVGFGCVGDGGISPGGQIVGRMSQNEYASGDFYANGSNVDSSREFIFNSQQNGNVSYMRKLSNNMGTYWHASLQKNGLYGYGLTLLNYERYLIDQFFHSLWGGLTNDQTGANAPGNIGNIFNGRIVKKNDEYSVRINMMAKTKNITNNGTPYSAQLQLIFNNTDVREDRSLEGTAGPAGTPGWGYITNISPIIERVATI
tara:strand:+ start:1478 stop:3694 length:2217 start_codon:yes stop_codon:yes gene_type:complete